MKKTILTAILLASTGLANAGTVSLPGGITFQEQPVTDADNGAGNFKSDFPFVQWWENSSTGVATSLTDMFAGAGALDIATGSSSYDLNGYGELNVNTGATGAFKCNGCEMTFAFEGLGLSLTPTTIDNPTYLLDYVTYIGANGFISEADYALIPGATPKTLPSFIPGLDITSGAKLEIYVDYTPELDIGLNYGDKTDAIDGTLWLEMSFQEVDFGVVAADADFAVAGLNRADSSFGLVAESGIAKDSFVNAQDIRIDGIIDLFADMVGFGMSADFGQTAGVYNTYSINGSGIASGFAVPEPTSVAIFGLGLLGLAGAARRKQS